MADANSADTQGRIASPSQLTVLLVEDEVLIRMSVGEELREEGFLVLEAGNAQEAKAILQSQTPVDLLFTDIQMPGEMDGVALARFVRGQYPDIKVIFGSANLRNSEAQQIAHAFFSKPYDFASLKCSLRGLLNEGTTG